MLTDNNDLNEVMQSLSDVDDDIKLVVYDKFIALKKDNNNLQAQLDKVSLKAEKDKIQAKEDCAKMMEEVATSKREMDKVAMGLQADVSKLEQQCVSLKVDKEKALADRKTIALTCELKQQEINKLKATVSDHRRRYKWLNWLVYPNEPKE